MLVQKIKNTLYSLNKLNFATNVSEHVVFIYFQKALNHCSQQAVLIYNTVRFFNAGKWETPEQVNKQEASSSANNPPGHYL